MAEYPTRGFSIEQPTIAEMQLTGWLGTARFERMGHRYDIRFQNLRAPGCLRDDKPIAWHKMNAKAQATAYKAADWLQAAYKLSSDSPAREG